MPKTENKKDIFSSKEACAYLGIDFSLFRYHVYVKKNLLPDYKIGHNIAFHRATLDEFRHKHQAKGYTITEAAEYLGVETNWIKNHLFNTKLLVPDGKNGQYMIFNKETLDAMRFFLPQKDQRQATP
jgi:hypothetical protein